MFNERSTTGGSYFQTKSAAPVSTYGQVTAAKPQQISYFADEATVNRRLMELPENDAYYISNYGFNKRQYLAFLMAEEFTFQLYQATQLELNLEPFDCNALLLQEIRPLSL